MIKKIKIELFFLVLLLVIIFISNNLDFGIYFYFKEFDNSSNQNYLKNFFVNITTLGDSFWYFIFCIMGVLVILTIEKTKIFYFINLKELKNFFYFSTIIFLFTGLVTQILKHIVGRARPNYIPLDGSFEFNFFTINSNFHSFPSGHSSTIFVLALILSTILPRLKYFFLSFALIVALSRVVVGAHFLTDIIGGGVVAFLSFKFINIFFDYKFNNLKPKKNKQLNENLFFSILVVFILLATMLTLGPSFDLFFSNIFYKDNNKFVLQSYYLITIFFRDILLPLILFYILILPIVSKFFPIKIIFFRYRFSYKDIFFLWFTLIINLIFVVNLFFKVFWGRARPGDISQLGGNDTFSPWYQISDACVSNCSFVSGDAAVGFSLVVLYLLTNKVKYVFLSVFFGSIIGLVRIAEGGHFLSDVVFSAIIIFMLSFFIKKIFYGTFYDY